MTQEVICKILVTATIPVAIIMEVMLGYLLAFVGFHFSDIHTKIRRNRNCCNLWTVVDGFDVQFWCTEEMHKKAEQILLAMPDDIKKIADRKGLVIRVLSSDLFHSALKQRGRKSIMRFCCVGICYDEREILLNADSSNLDDTIAHELAHFCDYVRGINNFYSETDDALNKEYQKHRAFNEKLVPMYNRKNRQEFLAYCMSNYICNRLNNLTAEMIAISEDYLSAIKAEAKKSR